MSSRLCRFFFLLFLIGLIVGAFSCKTLKTEKKPEKKLKKLTTAELVENYQKNNISYEWLSLRAKIDYRDSRQQQSANLNLRMKSDSIIWASVTAVLGIEVARALIRPDSLFLLDRLNKVYYQKPFSYLDTLVGFPVSFRLLEKLLVGNLPLEDIQNLRSGHNDTAYVLTGKMADSDIDIRFQPDAWLPYDMELVREATGERLKVLFSDFKKAEQFHFPFKRSLYFSGRENLAVDISLNRVKLHEVQAFPFSHNEKYELAK